MSVIDEVIRNESDASVSFGDYVTKTKRKVNDFEVEGDLYKVKTHNEITRLEKNGKLLLEAVPGAAVHHLKVNERLVTFSAEGFEDTQITMELEPEKEYRIVIDGVNVGSMKSNLAGKVNFSMELTANAQEVRIEKF